MMVSVFSENLMESALSDFNKQVGQAFAEGGADAAFAIYEAFDFGPIESEINDFMGKFENSVSKSFEQIDRQREAERFEQNLNDINNTIADFTDQFNEIIKSGETERLVPFIAEANAALDDFAKSGETAAESMRELHDIIVDAKKRSAQDAALDRLKTGDSSGAIYALMSGLDLSQFNSSTSDYLGNFNAQAVNAEIKRQMEQAGDQLFDALIGNALNVPNINELISYINAWTSFGEEWRSLTTELSAFSGSYTLMFFDQIKEKAQDLAETSTDTADAISLLVGRFKSMSYVFGALDPQFGYMSSRYTDESGAATAAVSRTA
jgi:hypothetical protein